MHSEPIIDMELRRRAMTRGRKKKKKKGCHLRMPDPAAVRYCTHPAPAYVRRCHGKPDSIASYACCPSFPSCRAISRIPDTWAPRRRRPMLTQSLSSFNPSLRRGAQPGGASDYPSGIVYIPVSISGHCELPPRLKGKRSARTKPARGQALESFAIARWVRGETG